MTFLQWYFFSFSVVLAPFFSLTSIIICDILDLEALTNAYGIVIMIRGIASIAGSPVAGKLSPCCIEARNLLTDKLISISIFSSAGLIVSATSTFTVALLVAGATVIIGGVLYLVIIFIERTKLKKNLNAVNAEKSKCSFSTMSYFRHSKQLSSIFSTSFLF